MSAMCTSRSLVYWIQPTICNKTAHVSNHHQVSVHRVAGITRLLQLVLEVLAALVAHHKVVLHGDRETVADGVPCIRALGLRQRTRGRLVRNARGHALVERPHIPLDLGVHVLDVLVRQEDGREGRGRGVRDEPIHPVCEIRVGALERVRQMPSRVALVALQVRADVACSWSEYVLVVLDGGVPTIVARRHGVGASPHHAGVAIADGTRGMHCSALVGDSPVHPFSLLVLRVPCTELFNRLVQRVSGHCSRPT